MKALLMHPDRDFDPKQALPQNERALVQDLAIEPLLHAMTGGDAFLTTVARTALLASAMNDLETILYRHEVVRDCLGNSEVVTELYALATEAIESKKKSYWGFVSRNPLGMLYGSIELLERLAEILGKLKSIAELRGGPFTSRGFAGIFAMLRTEFSDEYLGSVRSHLSELKFKRGMLLSAELGDGNGGTGYLLRRASNTQSSWFDRLVRRTSPTFTFRIAERDESGARALTEIKNRGVNLVANAASQSSEHILSFFEMLKSELAFYVCCLNLYDTLASIGAPVCLPQPVAMGARKLHFTGLYDVSLALSMGRSLVGNTVDADNKSLVIITGANQGGKSSFLRSIGLSQLMMQCGMFVGADSFTSASCAGLFTHYTREEDATMNKGKLDEELSRLNDIVDAISPNAMMLFNESFAATNEREGSEIARQVTRALLDERVIILFVTHLYDFAHGAFASGWDDAIFLRAQRSEDGTRTFRLEVGEPLETSYGQDVYRAVFGLTGQEPGDESRRSGVDHADA